MNCDETQRLLHGYLDGELDLAGCLAVEAHLRACGVCRSAHERNRALRTAISRSGGYFRASSALARRVARNLRDIDGACDEGRRSWGRTLAALAALSILAAAVAWFALPGADPAPRESQAAEKVVYHVNNSADASNALRNVMNHLEVSPNARIVVVAHNQGVDFLLEDAKDPSGKPYRLAVAALAARGVDFRVCQITLARNRIDFRRVIPEASLVPSGIAEITRLQVKEGYAYLKP